MIQMLNKEDKATTQKTHNAFTIKYSYKSKNEM